MLIKIGITESQLVGELSPTLKHKLRASLSYLDQGQVIARRAFHKRTGKWPTFGKLAWNGQINLINAKNIFPTGLVPRVRQILKENNIKWIETEDYKIDLPKPVELSKPVNLWEHQIAAVESIKNSIRGIIQIGTGGGKTITSIVASSEVGQLPVLFVVNRIKLLKQAHHHYENILGEKVGKIGDGEMSFGRFNIATIHTICSILNIDCDIDDEDSESTTYTKEQLDLLKKLLESTRMVIVDECHHASSSMYTKLTKNLPKAVYCIGLSATPYRTDGTDILLEAAFGPVIYKISASELIRKEKLAKPIITFIKYKDKLSEQYTKKNKSAYQTIYKNCIVDNETYNSKVAQVSITNAMMKRLTLVSVTRIEHGNNILKEIQKIKPDINVVFLNGENKDIIGEDKVIEDFTNKKIDILISTLMDEGVDIPAIDAVINAGGGKSPMKALQLCGRAMRLYPGKKLCYVYEFIHPYLYLYNHAVERANILKMEEEFVIKTLEI
jgi:superfamily II DNA or RNA helicase